MFKKCLFVCAGLLALCCPVTASADIVIYNLDYDTTLREGFFATGSATSSVSFTNTEGVAGTNAGVVTFDADGFSTGLFNDILASNILATPTSNDLSDYVYSFDARASGFLAGQTSVSGQTTFSIDGTTFVNNQAISVTDQFQTFSFVLGSGAVSPTVFQAANGRPAFTVGLLGIDSRFEATGNTLVFDNFSLTQLQAVPEPSSIALFAITLCCGLVRRRKAA